MNAIASRSSEEIARWLETIVDKEEKKLTNFGQRNSMHAYSNLGLMIW